VASRSGTAGAGVNLHRFLALILAALLTAVFGACGDDNDTTPTPSPTSSATATPTNPATVTPTAEPQTTFGPEYSSELALEYARVIAEEIGSRPAGSQAELAAAEYIRGQLESFGYDAELQPFPIQTYLIIRSDLSAQHASGTLSIDATPLTRSGSGNVSAEAVYVGIGHPEDYPSESAGRVALIERGEITFSEKLGNALNAGVVAAVIFNNEGGPFGGTLATDVPIPVVSISREDGLVLRDLLDAGAVTMTVDVEIQTNESTSHNVVAEPPDGECRIIAGGHYDSVPTGPGANDNGSGTAVVMEIARSMAADGAFDDICFVLFGSEEIGLVGSAYYVDTTSLDDVEAMLNFDMLAVGEGWPISGSTEIVQAATEIAEDLEIPYLISGDLATGGSDHASFVGAGVPSLIFNCFCDPNYHTAADRFSFLSEERLADAGALGIGLIKRLLAE
jgi:aminopeptidase YwaD